MDEPVRVAGPRRGLKIKYKNCYLGVRISETTSAQHRPKSTKRILTPLLLACASTPTSYAQSTKPIPASLQEEIKRATSGDTASAMNLVVDRGEATLSRGMLQAIRAVENYRARVQAKVLTRTERDFGNFNIHVYTQNDATPIKWLREEEQGNCYVVSLSAQRLPGEVIYTDTYPKLGRSATYAVRKSDFKVIRSDLGMEKQIK